MLRALIHRFLPSSSSKRQLASRGYGLALLMVFLASSILIAASTSLTLAPAISGYVGTVSQDDAVAKQLAEEALNAAQADILTQQGNGTTITTAYRYPASGTNTVSIPTYPGSGATTAKGTYYVTVPYARGFTFLLKANVTVGSNNVAVSRLVQLNNPPDITASAYAIYGLRKIRSNYSGPAVQVRCTTTGNTTDIGFTASGDFDLAAFKTCLGDDPTTLPGDVGAQGAKLAYGLRKLKSAYSGYALQVRRTTPDTTTQDIGFDANGNLDVAALLNFVGSGSGYISIWYDQSGNGKDVSQSNNSKQPRIVNAGKLETKNNQPSIYFDGIDDSMSNSTLGGTLITGTQYRAFTIVAPEAGGNEPEWGLFGVLWKSGAANSFNTPSSTEILSMAGATDEIGTAINNGASWGDGITAGVLYQHTNYHNASFQTLLYRNGTPVSESWPSDSDTYLEPTHIILGTGAGTDANTYGRCHMSEVIIFNNNLSNANRQVIERNEWHHFNVAGVQDGYVTKWYDQSGNGRHLSQSDTTLQPLIIQSPNRPSVYFDGAQYANGTQTLEKTGLSLTTDKLTLLSTAQITSESPTSDGRLFSVRKTADSYDWQTLSSSGLLVKTGTRLGSVRMSDTLKIATDITFGRIFQATVLFDGSTRTLRQKQNGLATINTSTNGTGNLTINIMRMGQMPINTADSHEAWKGNIYEVILFPTNLSASNYQTLEAEQQSYYSVN